MPHARRSNWPSWKWVALAESPMRISDALRGAQGITPLEARLLMLHVLQHPRGDHAWLLAHDQDFLPLADHERFQALCRRRRNHEPLAYLTGEREFFGLTLRVDGRVLDPRPDTETLVDWALTLGPSLGLDPASGLPMAATEILDLGTGSGAIALALAHTWPTLGRSARVTALDASAAALDVARANGQALALPVRWLLSQWFASMDRAEQFDLIVSNPPYIAASDPHLAVLQHEPPQALVSGADGLDDLRSIVAQAPLYLRPGGWLLLEHGWDQAAAVRRLLDAAGFREVQSRCDLAGIERCSGGRLPRPTEQE